MHTSIWTCMSHYPRHVSGLDMPIFRRNNCTNLLIYFSKVKTKSFRDSYAYLGVRNVKVKVNQSRNRSGVAQKVPGVLDSQISLTFDTWRWWDCQPHAPVGFTSRKCSWYSISVGTESTPGPWYGQKKYVTEKSSDTTGNWPRDHPTSSTAP